MYQSVKYRGGQILFFDFQMTLTTMAVIAWVQGMYTVQKIASGTSLLC